ncbi:MAG: hypothetical protein ABI835_11190, partial [Chloroflexota bacterium]
PFQLSGISEAIIGGGGIGQGGYSVVMPPLTGVVGNDLTTVNRDAIPDTALLGEWGVTHVVAAYPLNVPMLEQVDVIDGVDVYANRDPALTTDFPDTPEWVEGWANLPDHQMVEMLNQSTSIAALVSGVTFIGLIMSLIVLKVRE